MPEFDFKQKTSSEGNISFNLSSVYQLHPTFELYIIYTFRKKHLIHDETFPKFVEEDSNWMFFFLHMEGRRIPPKNFRKNGDPYD